MLLSKRQILELVGKGLLVRNMVDASVQIQQCGIDLTAANVFVLSGEGVLDFSNEKRKIPQYEEVKINEDKWILEPGTYHIAMNETITLPKNIAGLLLPRSSALTCGIEVHSALWDPGYEGRSFMHASITKKVTLYKNARIAQMIFFSLEEETESYTGKYKGEDILSNKKRG